MSTHRFRDGQPPEVQVPKKGIIRGLLEGIRSRKERSAAAGLMDDAIAYGRPEDLSAAKESISTLGPESRETVLLKLQARLEHTTSFPFESEGKVRTITVAAELFEAAAGVLPKNGEGEPVTTPFSRSISILRHVSSDNNLYEFNNPSHRLAKLACARALWELGAGSKGFWEDRLTDPATSEFTMTRLLEMGAEEKTAEGWPLLRKQLPRIAIALASCQSGRSAEFFTSMLLDSDPAVLRAALAGAIYLESIPPEFSDIARDISRLGHNLDIDAFVFAEGSRFKAMLPFADERQFDGAKGLIDLYSRGAGHLAPLLHDVGVDMAEIIIEPHGTEQDARQRQMNLAGEVLGLLAFYGIKMPRIPGFSINIQFDVQKEG